MPSTRPLLALVTAPDLTVARKLARAALQSRLVACANLLPKLESRYWWKGKLETSSEVLLLFKTTSSHATALEKLIVSEHPYDTPEFILLPVARVNQRYLAWWTNSLRPRPRPRPRSRPRT